MDRTLQRSKLFNSKHNSNGPGLPFQTKGCPVPLLPLWSEGVTDSGFLVKKPCGSHTRLCPTTSMLSGQKGSWTSGYLILISLVVGEERGHLSRPLTDDNSAGLSGWRSLSLSERCLGSWNHGPFLPSRRKWVQLPAPRAVSPALENRLPEITRKMDVLQGLEHFRVQKGICCRRLLPHLPCKSAEVIM